MKRIIFGSLFCLTVTAAAACSGNRDQRSDRPLVADVAPGDRDRMEITGCLTTNPRTQQFVLTAKSNQLSSVANRSAAGEAETYHYQLVGGNDLGSMIGKEVKVTGALVGKGKDVDAQAANAEPAPNTGGTDATPVVKTTEQIELQVEQLRVASITPTGSDCQVGK